MAEANMLPGGPLLAHAHSEGRLFLPTWKSPRRSCLSKRKPTRNSILFLVMTRQAIEFYDPPVGVGRRNEWCLSQLTPTWGKHILRCVIKQLSPTTSCHLYEGGFINHIHLIPPESFFFFFILNRIILTLVCFLCLAAQWVSSRDSSADC
jgi:hypothetical protein